MDAAALAGATAAAVVMGEVKGAGATGATGAAETTGADEITGADEGTAAAMPGETGEPQRAQNCAEAGSCVPHLPQKMVPSGDMAGHYTAGAGGCKAASMNGKHAQAGPSGKGVQPRKMGSFAKMTDSGPR